MHKGGETSVQEEQREYVIDTEEEAHAQGKEFMREEWREKLKLVRGNAHRIAVKCT